MTTTATAPRRPTPEPTITLGQERRLPKWVLPALLVVCVAAVWGFQTATSEAGPTFIGVAFLSALLFIVVAFVVSRVVEGPRWAADTLARVLVYGAFGVAVVPLFSLLWTVIVHGGAMLSWDFISKDMTGIFGDLAGGGVFHAIVGTAWVTGIAALIAVPTGIFCAIYLVEYGNNGRLSRGITTMVDVMTGIPSIVAGLFAYSLFAQLFGPGYKAGVIGAVALAVLMTPLVVRQTEEMLRLVPNELREAAYALGVAKWRVVTKVVLRTAVAGITTGVMIALARVIGETAPLLVTVGTVTSVNNNPFDGRTATLPVIAYRFYAQGDYERAWGAALVLVIIVMLLNLIARWVSKTFAPKGGH